jgi:hypothetical protein
VIAGSGLCRSLTLEGLSICKVERHVGKGIGLVHYVTESVLTFYKDEDNPPLKYLFRPAAFRYRSKPRAHDARSTIRVML